MELKELLVGKSNGEHEKKERRNMGSNLDKVQKKRRTPIVSCSAVKIYDKILSKY